MDISNINIKLKENKTRDSLETARFTLSYSQSRDSEEAKLVGYELLSRLKGSLDVIMELNSNLFLSKDKPKDDIIQYYVDFARRMGLNYKYSKIPFYGGTVFTKLFRQENKQEAHQLMIHIPSAIWEMEGFTEYINTCGTRYYFSESSGATDELIDRISGMTDLDRLEFFRLIVFDIGAMGSMGINSRTLGLNDIKKLLNLI